MQKEVSDLKVENQNLKRLLLRQGSSGAGDRPFRNGVRSSMSFRERGPSTVHSPDFRLSLTDSSSSLCDVPTTKFSLKYSLTDSNSSGKLRKLLHSIQWSFSPRKRGSTFLPTFYCVCLSVCLSVTTITKKIVDGFVPNFTGSFLGGKGRPSSCFVTIGRGMWK